MVGLAPLDDEGLFEDALLALPLDDEGRLDDEELCEPLDGLELLRCELELDELPLLLLLWEEELSWEELLWEELLDERWDEDLESAPETMVGNLLGSSSAPDMPRTGLNGSPPCSGHVSEGKNRARGSARGRLAARGARK